MIKTMESFHYAWSDDVLCLFQTCGKMFSTVWQIVAPNSCKQHVLIHLIPKSIVQNIDL